MGNENKSAEPHVTVLGEEVSLPKEKENACGGGCCRKGDGPRCWCGRYESCRCCGGGFGGLTIMLIGLMLLLNSAGLVSWEIWRYFALLWPLIIIAIGLRVAFGKSSGSRAIASIFIFMVFLAIALAGLVKVGSPVASYLHLPPQLGDILNQFKF